MTYQSMLGFGRQAVCVQTSDRAALQWLHEFIGPDFDDRAGATPGCTIRLHVDPASYDALRAAGPMSAQAAMSSFAFDQHVENLPRWVGTSDDAVVLHDSDLQVFYCQRPASQTVEIVSPAGRLSHRLALLRVLRELTIARCLRSGAPILHAAAFEWHGHGYAIAGPKRAGKTTLLLHLLDGTGARFCANDRAVAMTTERVRVRGLPTIVKVRPSSLECLPTLRRRFEATPYHHRWLMAEAEQRQIPLLKRTSYDLTPAQLARLLAVERAGEVPLTAVVFPRLTGGRGVAVTELSGSETASRLRSSLFRAYDTTVVGEFFAGELAMPDRDAACARMAERIVGLDCALGVDAYTEAGAAPDLLRVFASYSVPARR